MKIGITNLKGGVGKTTLSINLAVCFAHMGYKVCIVDTDTNQNSSGWYGSRDSGPEILVVGTTDPKALNKAVEKLHNEYEIVIMDGTPNLSEMNTRVMMASDLLIIPTRPGAHDFRAMNEFITRFNQVKELRENIAAYFLINEYDERINLHRTIRKSLQEGYYDIPVLETVLKSRTAYGEASLMGTGVFEHTDSKAKAEMILLTTEILKLAEEHQFINQ
jgi:chromosome partitioning protein